ncbi:hypothetical protein PSHT_13056 [Puccinia striiformis]|uniref:RRM domain-containing protein n=1 Tax=Puccinia striiformis TaxID=27350 RepID=A0A2S4UT41_9BASI|nr:hypothetical protein PSHT_13056 [Puccinia striiformis]
MKDRDLRRKQSDRLSFVIRREGWITTDPAPWNAQSMKLSQSYIFFAVGDLIQAPDDRRVPTCPDRLGGTASIESVEDDVFAVAGYDDSSRVVPRPTPVAIMSNSAATVNVSGISETTTEHSLNEFFSFCGKIKSIQRTEKSATIVFEKESAAKTSLMLDGGTLDNSVIQVTLPASSGSSETPASPTTPGEHDELKQEDKPRSAIAAEYLAHGYILGDQAVAKAIALDQKHGISAKFSTYFHKTNLELYHSHNADPGASGQSQASYTDSRCYSSPISSPAKGLSSLMGWSQQYYEKALASKHGAKVKEFYTTTSKQVLDVHSEATRIAEEKTGHSIFQFPFYPPPPQEGSSAPTNESKSEVEVKSSAPETSSVPAQDEKK